MAARTPAINGAGRACANCTLHSRDVRCVHRLPPSHPSSSSPKKVQPSDETTPNRIDIPTSWFSFKLEVKLQFSVGGRDRWMDGGYPNHCVSLLSGLPTRMHAHGRPTCFIVHHHQFGAPSTRSHGEGGWALFLDS
jgi:hypothetical protein